MAKIRLIILTTILFSYINTQALSTTYDPCIYVKSSSLNSTIDVCIKAGDCCAFKWSYNIDYTSKDKVDFITCVSRKALIKVNPGVNYITEYLWGLEDVEVMNTILANGITYYGCESSFLYFKLLMSIGLFILLVI